MVIRPIYVSYVQEETQEREPDPPGSAVILGTHSSSGLVSLSTEASPPTQTLVGLLDVKSHCCSRIFLTHFFFFDVEYNITYVHCYCMNVLVIVFLSTSYVW